MTWAAVLALGANIMLASPAAADKCYALGQQAASQDRGTLAKVFEEEREGELVCVIIVLVPARDGERPRRQELVLAHR